jgi:hypothetical protein
MSGRQGGPAKLQVVAPTESESARKVKRGEMSLDEYLDERAEEGLAHLKGKVADSTLETVRFVLREKLRTDPGLVEAVKRATGMTPQPFPRPGKN